MRWLASAWRGDFATSVRVCVEAAGDERLRPATRDLFVAIAVLDHFSLTDATADTYGLVPRALEVAGAHRAARPHRTGPAGGSGRGTARTSASRLTA